MNDFTDWIESIGFPFLYLKIILGAIIAYLITFFTIPEVIKISRKKNLMDEPGSRSSHLKKIPNLGGIAIFFAIGVCAPIFAYELFDRYKFLFASLIILFFVGVMDDIVVLRAYKKLIAQIVVSCLIVVGSDVRIRSMFGLFGVYEINYFVSVFISILTFVILINAFNLIDGIDGLAGSYTIVTSLLFGVSFYRLGMENYPLMIFCSIIVASTAAFLYYNLTYNRKTKIFMGDTGSMILGFLLAFTSITFIEMFIAKKQEVFYHLQSAPVIAIAILIFPIVDMLVVIITRLYHGKSIMSADRNHIHHKVLNLGYSHRRSTLYIVSYYMLIVVIAYYLRHINVNLLLFIILCIGFIGAYLPIFILKFKK